MMESTLNSMVEVRPLRPFVGSFRCALADADYVDDVLDETPAGIVKIKQPRKRIIGRIAERRALSLGEIEASLRGELAANIQIEQPEMLKGIRPGAASMPTIYATVHPVPATVHLPPDMAADLEKRGIVEIVSKPAKAAK